MLIRNPCWNLTFMISITTLPQLETPPRIRNATGRLHCKLALLRIVLCVLALQISRQVLISIMGLGAKLCCFISWYCGKLGTVYFVVAGLKGHAHFTTDVSNPHLHPVLDCLGKQQPSCRVIERLARERVARIKVQLQIKGTLQISSPSSFAVSSPFSLLARD